MMTMTALEKIGGWPLQLDSREDLMHSDLLSKTWRLSKNPSLNNTKAPMKIVTIQSRKRKYLAEVPI